MQSATYSVIQNDYDKRGRMIGVHVSVPPMLMRDIMAAIERSGISYEDAAFFVPKWTETVLKNANRAKLKELRFRVPEDETVLDPLSNEDYLFIIQWPNSI